MAFGVNILKENFDIAALIIFLIDIIMHCNTSFISKGLICKSRVEIFINYMKTRCIIDFISISLFISYSNLTEANVTEKYD